MKTLAIMPHFFNNFGEFNGKSKTQLPEIRHDVVKRSIESLNKLKNVEILKIGYKDYNLLSVDVDVSDRIEDPQLLVYEAFCHAKKFLGEYDYFIFLEDDILVEKDLLINVKDFDQSHHITECFHPNRIEYILGLPSCVDLHAHRGKTEKAMQYRGRSLRVYRNPHSAISIFSREKLDFAFSRLDLGYREKFLGGYMASAFAYFNSPFDLYRVADGFDWHKVVHLDHFKRGSTLASLDFINSAGKHASICLKKFIRSC